MHPAPRRAVSILTFTAKPTHAFSESRGFGFGAEVLIDLARSNTLGSPGQCGWYGAATN